MLTATVVPGSTFAVRTTAPYPVTTPQPISAARSSGMSSRTFTSACSCTTICSANDDRFRNWFMWPPCQRSRLATPGGVLTSVSAHSDGRPDRHSSQCPQNTDRQLITWSPGFR